MAKAKTSIKRVKSNGDKLDINGIYNITDGTITYFVEDEEITRPLTEIMQKQYDGQEELECRFTFEVKDSYEVDIVD